MPDRRPVPIFQEIPESRSRGPGVTARVRRFQFPSLTSPRLAFATLIATFVLISAAAIPAIAALPIVQASSPAASALPEGFGPLPSTSVTGPVPWRAAGGFQLSDSQIYKAAVLAEAQRQAEIQALLTYATELEAQQRQAEEQAQEEAQARAVAAATETAAPAHPTVYGINGSYIIPNARITFYSCTGEGFCGNMSNGEPVHEGAAACSSDLPLGTTLRILSDPGRRVVVCLDRGLLSPTWIDVYFYDAADGWAWQSMVGTVSDIEILQ